MNRKDTVEVAVLTVILSLLFVLSWNLAVDFFFYQHHENMDENSDNLTKHVPQISKVWFPSILAGALIEPRRVLQTIREFARQESKEKNTQVRLRKTKLTTFMRRGKLPDFQMRKIIGAEYLVECRRGEEVRVYFFDSAGQLLSAENFKPNDDELKRLLRSSKRLPL